MVDTVNQVIETLSDRDAVGAHTLAVRRLLRRMGLRSEIYAHATMPGLRREALPLRELGEPRPGSVLIYQSATGGPAGELLATRPEPLVVNYHNITPSSFFDAWEPHIGAELDQGRRQIARLAQRCVLGIADSEFNRTELVELGVEHTTVVPVLVDRAWFDLDADPAELARLRQAREHGGADWLFVGRLAPNKAQHDVIAAFAASRATFDPAARLRFVGRATSRRYAAALADQASDLGVGDAVDLVGSVGPSRLAALYRSADVFVCLSDHEGFCVPILEAMHHRLPVVAYASSAVEETIGGAGLVLPTKPPTVVAGAVERVLSDDHLRTELVRRGERRVAEFDPAVVSGSFADAIREVLRRVG